MELHLKDSEDFFFSGYLAYHYDNNLFWLLLFSSVLVCVCLHALEFFFF